MAKSTQAARLAEAGYDDVVILDDPSYDTALIGVVTDASGNDHAVYDYDKMILGLLDDGVESVDDAVEWIEYNTIRALPYAPGPEPYILHSVQ